ncbi:DUF998 domain-containing protein [Serratia sp. M24T3]|uniref:DUF998 domain-containing protein n=1 Tax=Serratia sp. M24T3 TaxID=932213 RepID=UPI00025B8E12|nr:DUF998 domain-containing protein [Serratia sp. M24T3]EIC86400.1 hypothetical protein SPM24T3_03373 [Serratia sp. M24T3]
MPRLNGWQQTGAWCFSLGGIQYLLAEKITALGWSNPAYFYSKNYISDLGIPLCGQTADGRDICSPLHAVMNSGFAIEGILFALACWLLSGVFNGRTRSLFILAGLLHGIGGVLIACFHSGTASSGITLHQVGAVMAIGGGNLCLIAAAWLMHTKAGFGRYAWLTLFLGGVGLVCMFSITSGKYPIGIIERASVYPITFWQILTGFFLLIKSRESGAEK